jgi:hypothetical protein
MGLRPMARAWQRNDTYRALERIDGAAAMNRPPGNDSIGSYQRSTCVADSEIVLDERAILGAKRGTQVDVLDTDARSDLDV